MAAPKKRTAKGSPVAVATGDPVGKWAQVLAETHAAGKAIEPFEITENLVLYPPTPARAARIGAATNAAQAAVAAMFNASKHGAPPEEVKQIQELMEQCDLEYTKAIVGDDEFDAVQQYFEGRGEWEREAFINALKKQFLRLPDQDEIDLKERVGELEQALKDVDPEHPLLTTPGKGNESSTTSSTTGMQSRETSPSTSTESTPETGAEEPGPGHSF